MSDMMFDPMMSDYDPNLLAQLVGQQYNPYQGYPLKQVSDQMWEVYGPTPDYLIAQQFGMMTPNREDFSLDAFFAADPMLRGPIAEAMAHGGGDTMEAYNYLQGPEFQDRLREDTGRTEWDALVGQGDLRSIAAITPEERDDAAMDYYMRGLEGVLAGGAPTSQGLMQQYDMIAERMGGTPYPGAGQGTAAYGGAGFDRQSGMDPLGDLQSEEGINFDATPEGTAFGAGIQDIGAAVDPTERLVHEDGQQIAVIDGRKYLLPTTMERSGGRINNEYMTALRQVMNQRDSRMREERTQQGPDRGFVGEGVLAGLRNSGIPALAGIGGLAGGSGGGNYGRPGWRVIADRMRELQLPGTLIGN